MLPGYTFQALYGQNSDPSDTHTLKVTTSTSFYNNSAGASQPTWNRTAIKNTTGSVLGLDSWFAVGGAASNAYGIPKADDNVAAGGANLITTVAGNVLQNNDATAGIPLTTQDGYYYSGAPSGLAAPQSVTFVGLTNELDVFSDGSVVGNSFSTSNASVASLNGSTGPIASTNRVLIGQFTTDGTFGFELNIQIGIPGTTQSQNYVARNPVGNEISIPSLILAPNQPPTATMTLPAAPTTNLLNGTTVNLEATAVDADGSVASVEFFNNGVSIGVDNTAPYQILNWVGANNSTNNITAKATDNVGAVSAASNVKVIIYATNQAPTTVISAPATGVVPSVINISATANDVDGSVASVEFFVDGVSIGVVSSAPYQTTWNAVTGNHNICAKATDNLGLVGAQSCQAITVVANIPPTAAITAPTSSATYTAPQVVTINATATDPDGTVAQVEFFVNGVSIGVVTTGGPTYTKTWTSVVGTAVLTVKSTDDRGAVTTSAPVTLSIADPNALPYAVVNTKQTCLPSTFCMPVAAAVTYTVDNVIGYDIIMNFDKNKVMPTGNVTVGSALIDPSYVDIDEQVDSVNGKVRVSAFFKTTAPATAKFHGSGQLLCVEFAKTANFHSVDTAAISVSSLIESYFTGTTPKLVSSGKYTTYRDTTFYGNLKFWSDNQAIRYNAANPNQYLITNINGTNASCVLNPKPAVQPDVNGAFVYNIMNGLSININRDILNTTDVHSVLGGQDIGEAKTTLSGRTVFAFTPFHANIYQLMAMDVNLDGVVTAGDISQLQQRSTMNILEFKQAWNYNNAGVSNGQPSKDWIFVDSLRIQNDPAYQATGIISPVDNMIHVPITPFCLPVTVADYANCALITKETYKGVMLGDVDGSYAAITADGLLKSANTNSKIIFDLPNAIVNGNTVDVPFTFASDEHVGALDFNLQFNESKLTYKGIVNVNASNEAASYYRPEDKTLRYTSFNLDAYAPNKIVASIRFETTDGTISESDLNATLTMVNGKKAGVEYKGISNLNMISNANVSMYPNPAQGIVNVMVDRNATVQLMDMTGQQVLVQKFVSANQNEVINIDNLAAGIYMMKTIDAENGSTTVMKLIITE
jgi:hypothetical protein